MYVLVAEQVLVMDRSAKRGWTKQRNEMSNTLALKKQKE